MRRKRQTGKTVMRYTVFIAIFLVIFTLGLVTGRTTAPSVALEKPKSYSVEKFDTTTTVPNTEPTITQTTTTNWIDFVATAYCSCEKCCGVWGKNRPLDENGNPIVKGATGVVLEQGVSVAADTSIYPIGTKLEIDGLGTYIVHDRGGVIKNNKIDIYFNNHNEALKFGVKSVRVKVLK